MKNLLSLLLILFTAYACDTAEPQAEVVEEETKVETALIHPEWSQNATIYEANVRQMTPEGSFKAMEAKLPEIKALGVKIIWLMPIQPIGELNRKGGLGSYYSVKDYTAVNPEFGSMQDLKDLVNKAHELDMKIIIDWVANHTAWDHSWTVDHPDYYTKDSLGNFMPPVADWSDVIDLNYDNAAMRQDMIDDMIFWLNEANIDGFRCDVAGWVPTDFWNDARKQLDAVKPVFMLAEAEQEDHHEKAFDMSYGWELMHIMNHIAKGDTAYTARSIHEYMLREQEKFGSDTYRMYFLTNHDENSWNGTIEERYGDAEKAYAVLAFTIHGMPLVYSGQEFGNNKRLEFFEKDNPAYADPEIFEFYKTLMELNIANQALWNGEAGAPYELIDTNNSEDVIAYSRSKGEDEILVVINLSDEGQKLNLKDSKGVYSDVFSGEEMQFSNEQEVALAPFGFLLLKR